MTYVLRLPFKLAPGQSLKPSAEEVAIDDLRLRLEVKEGQAPALVIEGFDSETAAEHRIPAVWAGVYWAMIERGIAPDGYLKPQSPCRPSDPVKAAESLSRFGLKSQKVDIVVDTAFPAVYRKGESVSFLTGGQANLTTHHSGDQFLGLIADTLRLPHPDKVIADDKLKVAWDLFSAHHREVSANAKLLTLSMVLEALAPVEFKHPVALDIMDRTVRYIEAEQGRYSKESEEWASLDSLRHELAFRKEVSIRKRIRSLVASELDGEPDSEILASQAVRYYDIRSKLVHSAHVDAQTISGAVSGLKKLVERVLRKRFLRVAGI